MRSPSPRKKASNRPRSAAWATWRNDSGDICEPLSGLDQMVVLLTPWKNPPKCSCARGRATSPGSVRVIGLLPGGQPGLVHDPGQLRQHEPGRDHPYLAAELLQAQPRSPDEHPEPQASLPAELDPQIPARLNRDPRSGRGHGGRAGEIATRIGQPPPAPRPKHACRAAAGRLTSSADEMAYQCAGRRSARLDFRGTGI